MLVDVVGFICRGEHLGFVDVVHAERFKYLRFHKMTDAALCHDRNADRFHDLQDEFWVTHTGNAAIRADISGNAFQRHHRNRSSIFSNLCLIRRDHIHDHTPLKHFRESFFDRETRNLFFHATSNLACFCNAIVPRLAHPTWRGRAVVKHSSDLNANTVILSKATACVPLREGSVCK